MARSEARLQFDIWDGLESVPAPAKLLYAVILTDPTVNHAGVGRLSVVLWAQNAGMTEEQTWQALEALEREPQVVVDRRTQEVLVRTLIRRDEVWKQPYVLKGALKEALQARSPLIRRVLAAELRKLPPKQSDGVSKAGRVVVYPDPHAVADQLDPGHPPAGAGDPLERVSSGSPAEPTQKGFESLGGGGRGRGNGSGPAVTPVEIKDRCSRAREAEPASPPPPEPETRLETVTPPAVDRHHVNTADRAVRAIIPAGFPAKIRRELTETGAGLLAEGLDPEVLTLVLARWASRPGVSPKILPHFVSDVLRERAAPRQPKRSPRAERSQECRDRQAIYEEAEARGYTTAAEQFAYLAAVQAGRHPPDRSAVADVIELPAGRTA